MENVTKFPMTDSSRQEAPANTEARRLADAIETMLSGYSLADRETVIRLLSEKIKPDTSTKAGDVLGTLLRILPKRNEWTVDELKKGVSERGVTATNKQVFNAVGHLTRTGRIKRIGYGRYLFEGINIETTDDFGLGPSRTDEMDAT